MIKQNSCGKAQWLMGESANEPEETKTDAEKALAEGDEKQREARATLAKINEAMAERKKQPLQHQTFNPGARFFADDKLPSDDVETLELGKLPPEEKANEVKTETWSHSTLHKDEYEDSDRESGTHAALTRPAGDGETPEKPENLTVKEASTLNLKNVDSSNGMEGSTNGASNETKPIDGVPPSMVSAARDASVGSEQTAAEAAGANSSSDTTPSVATSATETSRPSETETASRIPLSLLPSGNNKKPASKQFYATVIGASIVSGLIGLFFGMRIPHGAIQSSLVEPASDAGFGVSNSALRSPTSRDFVADIVQQVMPAVVSIDIAAPTPIGPGKGNLPGAIEQSENEPHKHALGTGVIVRSDGYIVTSAHVIRGRTDALYATLSGGHGKRVRIVGKDPFTDIALLKIEGDHYPVVQFADARTFRPGDWAIAIGSPFGFDHSVSLGVISAIGRSISDLNNHVDLIQTDAAMNPGNSGGPLLNSKGEVIGINAVIKNRAQNIGFAVPVDVVRKVANEIIAHGDVKRPYIGIVMDDVNPFLAQNTGITDGVVVLRVVPSSPCAVAGLVQGDIVLKLDGQRVRNTKEARDILKEKRPGDVMEFVFFRKNGGEQTRKVIVGEYPYD